MALIFCEECGAQISDRATVCPQCGCPVSKKKTCPDCGTIVEEEAKVCPECGCPFEIAPAESAPVPMVLSAQSTPNAGVQQQNMSQAENNYPAQNNASQTVIVEQSKSNTMGIVGLVFAILGLVGCWVPGANFIIWFIGALCSFIGVFSSPRATAVIGLLISFIDIIIIVSIVGAIASIF